MGYTTWFNGAFETNKEMSVELIDKINKFAEERHCNGNDYPDINYHSGYPGYWCNWVATSPNTIEWNDAEKFYDYDQWLIYIIENFLEPNGIALDGEVSWEGEDSDDFGILVVKNNKVYARYGVKEYGLATEIKKGY